MEPAIDIDIKKKILKGGSWALIGKVITAVLGFAVNIVLARVLSPSDLGIFFLLQTIVTISVTIIVMGFDKGVIRFISAEIAKGKEYNVPYIIKKIFLVIFGSFVLWAVIFLLIIGKFLDNILKTTLITGLEWFIVIYVLIAIYQRIVNQSFVGMQRIDYATIFGGSIRGGLMYSGVFLVLMSVLALFQRHIGLELLFVVIIFSVLISFLSGYYHLLKELKNSTQQKVEDYFRIKQSLIAVLPMLLSDLIVLLMYRSDVWIIGMFSTKENVALYGAAAKLVVLVNSSLIIANTVLPPIISELFTKNNLTLLESVLRKTATVTAIPAFIALLLFMTIPGKLLSMIYGTFYSQAAIVLLILSIGQFFNVWAGSCQFTLFMTNNQKYNLIVNLISSIIIAMLSIILIRTLGIYGVAIAFTSGLVVENVLMIYIVKAKLGIWTQVFLNIFQYKRIIKSSIALILGK